jgi:hypothetical protein
VLHVLSKFLEVVVLWPLRIYGPVYEHGLMPFSEALSDKYCCPFLISGASFTVKKNLDLSMDLGQGTEGILVSIA